MSTSKNQAVPATRAASRWWSVAWAAASALIFVGERIVGAGNLRMLSAIGAFLLLVATVMRFVRAGAAAKNDPAGADVVRVERALGLLYLLSCVALLLYLAQSDLLSSLRGSGLDHDWPRLAVILAALWPALWLCAALPILLVELAYASVARAPLLEFGRIKDALLSGLGLAAALVFSFSIAYVASVRDHKVDLSYFRTARPGESTRKLVASLDQPIEVALFFPPANEVKEEVKSYFDDLTPLSKYLEVHEYDHALEPQQAKALGVSGNGTVAIRRGTRHELLAIGLELESARSQLASLDKELQKRLLQVARPTRTIYMTSGHGERTTEAVNDNDKRHTIHDLRELLLSQGYAVRTLGAAEGLASDVPADASVVMVVGPEKPFLPEEVAALQRYLERGGRLFLALDPPALLPGGANTPTDATATSSDETAWKELLTPLGLRYLPTTLANDQIYLSRSHQASDRINIATGSYSAHPSVTTLSHLGMRAPLILPGAGALDEINPKGRPIGTGVDFPVRAQIATFNDVNGNFTFDPPAEQRRAWQLAAAVLRKRAKDLPKPSPGATPTDLGNEGEMRTLVVASSGALSDGFLAPGNVYYIVDGMKWLLGDEALAGEVTSEVDAPMAHTRKQDVWWFYSTIFLMPLLVLGVGAVSTRRRRRSPGPAASPSTPSSKERS